jgi:H+/Cl- antiporter ClcA
MVVLLFFIPFIYAGTLVGILGMICPNLYGKGNGYIAIVKKGHPNYYSMKSENIP